MTFANVNKKKRNMQNDLNCTKTIICSTVQIIFDSSINKMANSSKMPPHSPDDNFMKHI